MSINLINTDRRLELNSKIVEWDLRRAGLNLIRTFQLLPEDKITELSGLEKHECDVKIGKMQIRDKEFSRNLEQAFTDIMNQFLDENQIDKDLDVLSIKKDACFVINKHIKKPCFGEFLEFVPKNEYHAYLYLPPLEMFFKRNGEIEIKNLVGDKTLRNTIMNLHKDGILNFILYVIDLAEKTHLNAKSMNKFLHEFVELYKRKELEFSYYREFNVESRFRFQSFGGEIMMDQINEKILEHVNIEYNYIHIILPLINLIV